VLLEIRLFKIQSITLFRQGEFVDDGTETHFAIADGVPAYIKAVSSGKRKSGIVHTLFVNNQEIPLTKE